MKANSTQIGGNHYKETKIQHWDYAASNNFDYFQGQITKYVDRWKRKNGIEDLRKAKHFLEKYIEIAEDKKNSKVAGLVPDYREDIEHPFGFDGE